MHNSEQSKPKKKTSPQKGKGTSKAAVKRRQVAFLKALPLHRYNITKTCDAVGVSRTQFYGWQKQYPEFLERLEAVTEGQLDIWEESLHKNILAGDTTAVIFALKTRGKARGYIEREPANAKVAKILEEVLAGTMTAREAGFKINAMGLPLPEVLKIELAKQETKPPELQNPLSDEELERIYQEAMEERERQLTEFLPARRGEVAQLKEDQKDADSFGHTRKE